MARAHMAAIALLLTTSACVADFDEELNEEEQMPLAESQGYEREIPMPKAADGTCETRIAARFQRTGAASGRLRIVWTDVCDGKTLADLRMTWQARPSEGIGELDGWLHTQTGVWPAFGAWGPEPGATGYGWIRITAVDNAGVEAAEIEGDVFYTAGPVKLPAHMVGVASL